MVAEIVFVFVLAALIVLACEEKAEPALGDGPKVHSAARGSPGAKVNVDGPKLKSDGDGHNVKAAHNVECNTHCAAAELPDIRDEVVCVRDVPKVKHFICEDP